MKKATIIFGIVFLLVALWIAYPSETLLDYIPAENVTDQWWGEGSKKACKSHKNTTK